ncbi:Metallo-dependent phosphatase-like protein [Lasiosphaeria miniovina]|uniref:Metallo-dependent phosphatase-like protein n=1 Tax=Lasiosphaeria miniovina TaxID=1954250 RepID=A0AA40ADN2_9PEZI|nr:Metallo-dependent phosphatase-like protein [Lasiosphaeria miniovina]KAK0713948.1 Metallo-dependent phosphatase-like protein [Lasiosphaeria miniovina]
MVFTLVFGLLLLAALPRGPAQQTATGTSISGAQTGPLAFDSDGLFRISIFEDLHFGENAWEAWGPRQDVYSVRVMEQILDAEPQTSLVVLNGDLITGENTFLENSTEYMDQIAKPMLDRGLTWASTYGNHDSDYNISASLLLEREQRWLNSRTSQMVHSDTAGVTNYYLPVYLEPCDDSDCTPALLLWFFDSRGGFQFQQRDGVTGERVGRPGWVDSTVVDWFKQTNQDLVSKAGRPVPALAFTHIPTSASLALQAKGLDPRLQPGINDDVPVAQQGDLPYPGKVGYEECEQDIPFLEALAATPGFMALFSAHNHGNTWCYKWDNDLLPDFPVKGNGINLCFGQHSGYGGYGRWIRGARQVVVSREKLEDLAIDTYIRLESGAAVGSVTLNATYGQDVYPATPNDQTRLPPD